MGFNFLKGNDETICNLLFVCVFFYSSGLFLFLVDGTAGEERVPQPPPGPEKSALPHNKTQRFEAEATLGPLASPRR